MRKSFTILLLGAAFAAVAQASCGKCYSEEYVYIKKEEAAASAVCAPSCERCPYYTSCGGRDGACNHPDFPLVCTVAEETLHGSRSHHHQAHRAPLPVVMETEHEFEYHRSPTPTCVRHCDECGTKMHCENEPNICSKLGFPKSYHLLCVGGKPPGSNAAPRPLCPEVDSRPVCRPDCSSCPVGSACAYQGSSCKSAGFPENLAYVCV